MEIKVCGIRRNEDIEFVNKYKPDYIGFIFAKSKRQITPQMARELSQKLNRDIKTVGVFVNAPVEEVKETAEFAGLYAVQLHGDENEEYISSLDVKCEIWKAVRVREGHKIEAITGVDRLLLDKYDTRLYGGGGKTFDWSMAPDIDEDIPVMLAGGLNKDNVLEGIRIFNPVGVDVSSSVETNGFKDEKKIREFIDTVRNEIK